MTTSLTDVISRIRDDLVALDRKRQAESRDALFQMSEVEIELNFTVEHNDLLKGGIDLKVVSFGGEDQRKSSEVQKIKIKLAPATEAGGAAPVGSRFRKAEPPAERVAASEVEPL